MNVSRSLGIVSVVSALIAFNAGSAMHQPETSSMQEGSRLEFQQIVNAPVRAVWKAWTTNEGVQTFFAPKANIDLRPGGAYEILFTPENPPGQRGAEDLRVLSFLPGEMLSFEWSAPPQFAHARPQRTWVVLMFDELEPGKTRVRLSHLGWDLKKTEFPEHVEEWDKVREYFAKAWPNVLTWLARSFEEGPKFDAQGNLLWK
jgi:uncharacterized protein YndB with AHSA1/START domain